MSWEDSNPEAIPARMGPRPAGFHLAVAIMGTRGVTEGWKHWNGVWPCWNGELAAACSALAQHPPEIALRALDRAGNADLRDFLAGVAAYHQHPYRQASGPAGAVVWQEGSSRLVAFGDATGPPVLIVPSLINRSTILDLMPSQSLVRWLAARGTDPYLIDWGVPGSRERGFGLSDYIVGRLERVVRFLRQQRPEWRPIVLGYCMGGTMAAGLAARVGQELAGLILMAAPWDFHAGTASSYPQYRTFLTAALHIAASIPTAEAMPVDAIQLLFAMADPFLTVRKYIRFGRGQISDPDLFAAVEDWVNDGVPLAAPVAVETLGGWYIANAPATEAWLLAGLPVRPQDIRVPTLAIIPTRDRVVPAASAWPLAAGIPSARILEIDTGHIGLVVSARARDQAWPAILSMIQAAHG